MIETVKAEVKNLLQAEQYERLTHGYEHALSVHRMAMKLAETEACDKSIVAMAALLHDCDDYKTFGQENADNLTNAMRIMQKSNVPEADQKAVCQIISSMGYNHKITGVSPLTIEGKIVTDADRLNAIGATGIIRALSFSLNKGIPTFNKDIFPNPNPTPAEYKNVNHPSNSFINHFFTKLLKLKNLMFTEAGKKEAQKRHDLMVRFLRDFFEEQGAADWSAFLEDFLRQNNALD